MVKKRNTAVNAGDQREVGLYSWVGKMPWRRKWQPTPVFLPGKFHGQRSLTGYSPRGHERIGLDLVTKIANNLLLIYFVNKETEGQDT